MGKRFLIVLLGISFLLSGCTIEYSFYIRNYYNVPIEVSISGLSPRAENFDVSIGWDTLWKGYLSYTNKIVSIDRYTDKDLTEIMNVTLVKDSLSLRIDKIVLPAKSTFHIQSATHTAPTTCEVTVKVNNANYKLDRTDMKTSKRNIYYLDIEP